MVKRFIIMCYLMLSAALVNAQYNLSNPDVLISSDIRNIDFFHTTTMIDSSRADIEMGESIGKIAAFPASLSQSFDLEIKQSQQLYLEGDYERAYKVIEKAVQEEGSNPFILETYARALYKIDNKKRKSYQIYNTLIANLDSINGNSISTLTVDMWFREAYWKLGTLHMDNGEWEKAQYEINRFIMSIQEVKGSFVYNQALGYLTECYFELGNKELCKHFGRRTLYYDPENQYVLSYLKNIE